MNITNIEITRVIVHEVVRASQLMERPPVINDDFVNLDDSGKSLISKRLVDTLASGSHCVEVMVSDATPGSPFDQATGMLEATDEAFIQSSQLLAQTLSAVQTRGSIKPGSVIFVQGTCAASMSTPLSRFLAIIKADADQGLNKRVVGENITLTYVNDMLLGESQRLVKIAFFIEEEHSADDAHRTPEEFSITVFDHLMQKSSDREAADYFYKSFLKCQLADTASAKTKQLYTIARDFIGEINVSPTKKVELQGDLISYFRGNRATLEPRTLAQDILPEPHQDAFIRKCRELGLTEAISKDMEMLTNKIARQSVKFSSNVTIYAPSDVFSDNVRIIGGAEEGWTRIEIRGSVEATP